MRRALLSWTLVFALLAAGFGASVLALNDRLYSAGGFVRSYLEALERGDSAAALATEGVDGAGPLVTDATVGGFTGIRIVSDVEGDDRHTVRAGYTMNGAEQITQFEVQRTGTRFGLFPTWRFAVSPIAELTVAVDFDQRLSINGVDAVAGTHALLVPSAVTLTHDTKYLGAAPTRAAVVEVGSTVQAALAVVPKPEFTEAATTAIADLLDGCAAQQVLKPTGCPFGTDVANRLDSTPAWSIAEYPTAALEPHGTGWRARGAGTAHITVRVKSLFDGTLSTLDEDVPFDADYLITIGADDSVSATLA